MTTNPHYCAKCSRMLSIAEVINEFCEVCCVDVTPTLNPPAHDHFQVDRGTPRDGVLPAEAA